MKSTRLFIGGLSGSIDKHMLTSKLSSYGPISDAEIKEKTDAEGNVTARFAYANIEAAPELIEQCVRALNGTSWQGAHLRVEVAKESFLDRLKRERSRTQEQQQKLPKPIQPESLHESYTKGYKEHSTEYEPKVKKKRRSYLLDSSDSGTKLNTSVDQEDLNDNVVQPVKVKVKSKKKNEAEMEMMASFKTFSSMWADTDEEDDDDEVVQKSAKERKNVEKTHSERDKHFRDHKDETAENGYATVKDVGSIQGDNNTSLQMQDKRQNWGSPSKISKHNKMESDPPFKRMTRYDPTLQEHQQFRLLPSAPTKEVPSSPKKEVPSVPKKEDEKPAEIPEEKKETVDSSCFSLLTMFNKMQQEGPAAVPQDHTKEASAQLPVQKSRSFFLGPRDKRIQDGIDWMLQNVQDNILPEFEAIESDLYDVIKTRSVRAKKEMLKKLNDGKVRGKGKRGSRRSTVYPVIPDQNYDHGWRLAEIIQDEKRGGTRTRGRGGRDMHSQGEGGSSSSRGRGGQRGHGWGQGEEDIQNRGRGEGGTYIQTRGRGEGGTHIRNRAQGDGGTYGWGRGDGDAYGRGQRGRANHKWDQGGGDNIEDIQNRGRGEGGTYIQNRGRGDRGTYGWGQGEGDTYGRGRRGRGNHKWDEGGRGNSWGRGGRGSHSRGQGGRGSRGRGRRIGQGLGREFNQDLD